MIETCIALIGASGSGKSEAAAYLATKIEGSVALKASDAIKREMFCLGLAVTANSLRSNAQLQMRRHGPAYWSVRMLRSVASRTKVVIVDGVRNLGGIAGLRQSTRRLYLLGMVADESVRLGRIIHRGRQLESVSAKKLQRFLREEMEDGPAWGLQLNACLQQADILIDANGSLRDVQKALDDMVGGLDPLG